MRAAKLALIAGGVLLAASAGLWAAGTWPFGSDRAPFEKFYRIQVSLTHATDGPVIIDYMLGCRVEKRKFFAQPADYSWVRVPMVFGVRTKSGDGVLTETPAVCDFGKDEKRSLEEQVPPDFLPINFHADDAGNLETMTAYLSERAYDQPFSKLKFQKATVVQVTEEEYEKWKATAALNIVPEAALDDPSYRNFFVGDIFAETDYRHRYPIECRSLRRYRIPETLRASIRALWPAARPQYWVPLLDVAGLNDIHMESVLVGSGSDPETPPDLGDRGGVIQIGQGIRRPNGQGMLFFVRDAGTNTGLADRIPVYDDVILRERDPGKSITQIQRFVLMSEGADQGFASCRRQYRQGGGGRELDLAANAIQRVHLDGQVIGEVRAIVVSSGVSAFPMIERDEFVFGYSNILFVDEFARQQ